MLPKEIRRARGSDPAVVQQTSLVPQSLPHAVHRLCRTASERLVPRLRRHSKHGCQTYFPFPPAKLQQELDRLSARREESAQDSFSFPGAETKQESRPKQHRDPTHRPANSHFQPARVSRTEEGKKKEEENPLKKTKRQNRKWRDVFQERRNSRLLS